MHTFRRLFPSLGLRAVALGLLLTACTGGGPPQIPQADHPIPGIAFVRETNGERDIYLIQPDGSGLERLIHSDAVDSDPAFSPDGRTLAFRSRRDGSSDLYLAAADGSGDWLNLVNDPADSFDDEFIPRWHPSGNLLALYTDRFLPPMSGCSGTLGVHHVGFLALDRDSLRIEHFDDLAGHQGSFSWSPDGLTLAINSACRNPTASIYLWNRDTREVNRLTDGEKNATHPAFSPDGRFLAYAVHEDGGADILLYELATRTTTNLTNSAARDFQPTWSPDSRWLAFTSNESGNDDIFLIRVDGTGRRNLTNSPARDILPDWSPAAP